VPRGQRRGEAYEVYYRQYGNPAECRSSASVRGSANVHKTVWCCWCTGKVAGRLSRLRRAPRGVKVLIWKEVALARCGSCALLFRTYRCGRQNIMPPSACYSSL